MVALISGKNLGLADASQVVLGLQQGDPALGRGGEKVWVNSASGNLLMQQQDDFLASVGLDATVLRTYNSQGVFDGDNNDNWRIGFYRQIKSLVGTVNTAGSTITRVDQDGSELVYTWDTASARYVHKDGTGSYDTLAYTVSTSSWTWTDGDSRNSETYDWAAGAGKLLASKDIDLNTLTYGYTGALLTSVTDASGEKVCLDYTGNNLTQVRVVRSDGATMATRTRYAYDASNRLNSVTVDLSPEDNAIADGRTYVTTYTYDGTSKRIASIAQTDGTSVAFGYAQVGGTWRVTSMTQTAATGVTRTTTYSYDTVTRKTSVTDPLGNVTVYTHDASSRLINVLAPAVGGVSQSTSFAWTANGNVSSTTDARGNTTTYTYDANGNLTLSRDALGNTVTQTWSATSQLLTRTVWAVPDPDGAGAAQAGTPLTTRYAYNAEGHLRWVISPEGRLTEYQYTAAGQCSATIEYVSNLYPVAGLAATTAVSNSNLNTWRDSTTAPIDKTRSTRKDMVYDFRGQLDRVTEYQTVDASGAGVSAGSRTTQYVYDAAGNLLQTIEANGVASTAAGDFVTQFLYDGLGRLCKTIDPLGNVTLTQFDDAGNTTRTTFASGLITTSTYNKAGALLNLSQSGTGVAQGTIATTYDSNDRVRRVVDARGAAHCSLYDAAGRQVATVDALGYLTEYQFDANDHIVKTTCYANAVTQAQLSALHADITAGTNGVTLATLRPLASAADASTWSLYDGSGRLAKEINGVGAVTEYRYDGAGRRVAVLEYDQLLGPASLAALGPATVSTDAATIPPGAASGFSRTRYLYDNDGALIATLGAAGLLTENVYDGAGRLVTTVAYATAPPAALWAGGTLAQLRPAAVTGDRITRFQYDAGGRVLFKADGAGAVTGYAYDANGNIVQERAYATAITPTAALDTVPVDPARDRITRNTYDGANRLSFSVDGLGAVTGYTYDAAGNATQVRAYANRVAADVSAQAVVPDGARDQIVRNVYDAANRLIYTADGTGSVTGFTYDANGNVVQRRAYANTVLASVSPASVVADAGRDQIVTNSYDAANQLSWSVDGMGAVTGYAYDARGNVVQKTAYANPSATTLRGRYIRIYHNDQQAEEALTSILSLTELEAWVGGQNVASGKPASVGSDAGPVDQFFHSSTALTDGAAKGAAWNGGNGAASNIAWAGGSASGTNYIELDLGAVYSLDQIKLYGRPEVADSRNLRIFVFDALPPSSTAKASLEDNVNVWRSDASFVDASAAVFTQGPVAATSANDVVTRYEFDAAGRQVKTIYPATGVYAGESDAALLANGAAGLAARTESAQELFTQAFYDAHGNIVANRDTAGNMRYQAYDAEGGLLYSVDAEGGVTQTTRDTLGNATVLTRYAALIGTAAWGTVPPSAQAIAALLAPCSADRQIRTDYDCLGRAVRVTQPSTFNLLADGTTSNASPVTEFIYDALGRIVQTRVLSQGNEWATTTAYFDQEGPAVATIDSLGYLTARGYDAFGNLVQVTEYANACSGWSQGAYTQPVTSPADRTTAFSWDQANRKTAEIRVDVDSSVGASSMRTNLTYTFAYDAFGNLVRQTDASSDLTRTYFDRANRITAVAAAKTIVFGNGDFIPLTEFRRDTFGNVIRQTVHADSAYQVSDSGYTLYANAEDRTGTSRFDRWGRVVEATDAMGNRRLFSYDSAGNLAKNWSTITVGSATQGNSIRSSFQVFKYDRLGRQTHTLESNSDGSALIDSQSKYNAFGELTARGIAGIDGGWSEFMDYDNGGRLWRTNAGGGVARVMLYDLQGRMTATLTSPSTDLKALADAQAAHQLAGTFRSVNAYDALGRITRETLANGASVLRTYDRWGNVLSASDPRDATWITEYAYDAFNRVLKETRPAANDGARPVTQSYYDASGNRVAVRDARGNVNLTTYNRSGTVQNEIHADGGVVAHSVNAFGEEVQRVDAMGNFTTYAYDKLGHMTRMTRAAATMAGALDLAPDAVVLFTENDYTGASQSFSLGTWNMTDYAGFNDHVRSLKVKAGYKVTLFSDTDTLGWVSANDAWGGDTVIDENRPNLDFGGLGNEWWRLVSSILVERDDATAAPTTTVESTTLTWTYDQAGRLLSSSNGAAESTAYRYDVRGNVVWTQQAGAAATTNKYDQLGHKTEEFTAGTGTIQSFSYFGKLVSRDDLAAGNSDERLTYDLAGRLVSRTNARGVSMAFSYDAMGKLTGVTDKVTANSWRTTTYTYDLAGNRTFEQTSIDGVVYQKEYLAYDRLGRLSYAGMAGRDVYYDYDAAGNRTHTQDFVQGSWHHGYYAYDSMNRQVLVDGALNGNADDAANLTSAQGMRVSYDRNGNRVREQSGALGSQIEDYAYDALGRLNVVYRGGAVVNHRLYDKADRVVWNSHRDSTQEAFTTDFSVYDAAGRLAVQSIQENGANVYQIRNSYDAQGNLTASVRGVHKEGGNDYFTSTNVYAWELTDRYRMASIVATRSDNKGDPGRTTYAYDLNGFLTGISDEDQPAGNRTFVNSVDGIVLQKSQQGNVVTNIVGNGQVLGSYGRGVDVDNPTLADGSPNYVTVRDFNIEYQGIDLAHPGTGNGIYRVNAGDTLRGIAQAAYGDADLWYLVADANGLKGDAELRVGQSLTLPNTVGTIHNNATTFKPYDPARIVGDTSPFVHGGSSGGPNCAQVGIIVAAVLVAVVITVATAGAASAAGAAIGGAMVSAGIATTGSLATTAVAVTAGAVGGAVGGALGSAASQGIKIAGGLQQDFSWSEVGIGALTGFVTGGVLGGAGAAAGALARGSTTFMANVLRGATCNTALTGAQSVARTVAVSAGYASLNVANDALAQGVRIAIGQQSSFDWRSTATAAISGIFGGAGGALGRQGSMRALAGGVAADLTGSALGNLAVNDGQFDPTQFAADAVSSLGSAVMGRVGGVRACFVAGTVIHTRLGPIPVERFVGGEHVLARSEESGEMGMRPVLSTRVTPDMPIWRVVVRNAEGRTETLRTTEEHPFWVKGSGWVKAALLTVDDVPVDMEDRDLTIVEVAMEDARESVYNIEVAQFHTYHVGELGVWVHNANCGEKRAAQDSLQADVTTRRRVEAGMFRKDTFFPSLLRGVPGPLTLAETGRLNARVLNLVSQGRRPGYAGGLVEAVWNAARRPSSGRVFDPNGGPNGSPLELQWDRFASRAGQWDMGHKPQHEYRGLVGTFEAHSEAYGAGSFQDNFGNQARRVDGAEFLLAYNNPDNYQPEHPGNNRSHRFEAS